MGDNIRKNTKVETFSAINILTEVMQQKIKIRSFGQKPLLKFVFCPVHISVTIHCRIAGFFCSVSKNVLIVQR